MRAWRKAEMDHQTSLCLAPREPHRVRGKQGTIRSSYQGQRRRWIHTAALLRGVAHSIELMFSFDGLTYVGHREHSCGSGRHWRVAARHPWSVSASTCLALSGQHAALRCTWVSGGNVWARPERRLTGERVLARRGRSLVYGANAAFFAW